MKQKVSILDTTLRDGQLSSSVRFEAADRIEIACALERAGVDIIEVAFPAMHVDDLDSTKTIVERTKESGICCLSRLNAADIDIAADVL